MKESLGDRMKDYEDVNRHYLTRRMPCIIRVDGKAFHSYTRGMDIFSSVLSEAMEEGSFLVMDETNCKLAYRQSDEVSFLLTDYKKFGTQPWVAKNLQKMVSIVASAFTAGFNRSMGLSEQGLFDARAFVIPREEVCNYFIWRQKDGIRNSTLSMAQHIMGKKECLNKSCEQLREELKGPEYGLDWDMLEIRKRRGVCIKGAPPESSNNGYRVDYNIPLFTEDREYIERYVDVTEE